ncbi:hypothetical protein EDB19DRAFT_1833858 [Suillus lakei]|nr:hypothetical protein EDB19DRAFT_1833858 [Suillus lakei]
MSTPVDTTLTGLKSSTAQIKAIIYGTWQIPPGPSHYALTSQVTRLVACSTVFVFSFVFSNIQAGSCSQGPWGWTPARHHPFMLQGAHVWPNWFSIGHDNPCLLKHPWHAKVLAWEALGDHTFDLPVTAPPSTGLIPVDLPSPPVHASNVAGPSTNPTTEYWDKREGKAIFADPEAEAEGSRKRKSLMISEPSSQPLKLVMKSHKHIRSTRIVKSKPFVESEDDDQLMIKLFSGGVPEVILPRLSTIIVPMKQSFGPATAYAYNLPGDAGSHQAGIEPPQQTPEALVQAPPVIDAGHILIPGLDQKPVHGMCLLHDKEDQVHLRDSGIPAKTLSSSLYHPEGEVQDTFQGSLQGSLQSSLYITIHGLSSHLAVPHAALDMLMLDLHAMAIAIQDGAAQITLLEARVAEQDGRFDTLQCLHESLQHKIVDWHPSFPLPDPPANATTMLLDQSVSVSVSMSPPESALPPLIDLSMAGMAPTPPTPKDASAIEGLVFEDNEVVHPEDPHTSSKHVDPGNPGNLVPEYNSADDMDVEVKVEEVKVEASSEETDMAT